MKKKCRIVSVGLPLANVPLIALLISGCAAGLLSGPTATPTFTPTAKPEATLTAMPKPTITPTVTPTPTITPAPTATLTPTLTIGEWVDAVVQVACQGKPATSLDVGTSTNQVGARLCPGAGTGEVSLPQNWRATTLENLHYVVNIQAGTTQLQSCAYAGGYSLIREREFRKIFVYNSVTGAIVKQTTIDGPNPGSCPTRWSFSSLTEYLGGPPIPKDALQTAMMALLQPFFPKPALPTTLKFSKKIDSLAFSPDGKWLALGSDDGTVKLLDVASGQEVRALNGHLWGLAFSPDGKWLASGSNDYTIKVWEVASGQEVHTLEGHNDGVLGVAFSPDGKWLASGSEDDTVKLWDVTSGQVVHTLEGHYNAVKSVAFSPDGKWLASGSYDETVMLWDVATGQQVRILVGHTHTVSSVAFSPDGKWLASGSYDGTVKLWDAASGHEVRTFGDTLGFLCVAFSPDGNWLAAGSDDFTVEVWEVASGQEVSTLEGHTWEVASVAFSPDGKQLASSGSFDNTVKLWDLTLP